MLSQKEQSNKLLIIQVEVGNHCSKVQFNLNTDDDTFMFSLNSNGKSEMKKFTRKHQNVYIHINCDKLYYNLCYCKENDRHFREFGDCYKADVYLFYDFIEMNFHDIGQSFDGIQKEVFFSENKSESDF